MPAGWVLTSPSRVPWASGRQVRGPVSAPIGRSTVRCVAPGSPVTRRAIAVVAEATRIEVPTAGGVWPAPNWIASGPAGPQSCAAPPGWAAWTSQGRRRPVGSASLTVARASSAVILRAIPGVAPGLSSRISSFAYAIVLAGARASNRPVPTSGSGSLVAAGVAPRTRSPVPAVTRSSARRTEVLPSGRSIAARTRCSSGESGPSTAISAPGTSPWPVPGRLSRAWRVTVPCPIGPTAASSTTLPVCGPRAASTGLLLGARMEKCSPPPGKRGRREPGKVATPVPPYRDQPSSAGAAPVGGKPGMEPRSRKRPKRDASARSSVP